MEFLRVWTILLTSIVIGIHDSSKGQYNGQASQQYFPQQQVTYAQGTGGGVYAPAGYSPAATYPPYQQTQTPAANYPPYQQAYTPPAGAYGTQQQYSAPSAPAYRQPYLASSQQVYGGQPQLQYNTGTPAYSNPNQYMPQGPPVQPRPGAYNTYHQTYPPQQYGTQQYAARPAYYQPQTQQPYYGSGQTQAYTLPYSPNQAYGPPQQQSTGQQVLYYNPQTQSYYAQPSQQTQSPYASQPQYYGSAQPTSGVYRTPQYQPAVQPQAYGTGSQQVYYQNPTYPRTQQQRSSQTQEPGHETPFKYADYADNYERGQPAQQDPQVTAEEEGAGRWAPWSQFGECCGGVRVRLRSCKDGHLLGTDFCSGPPLEWDKCVDGDEDFCVATIQMNKP